VLVDDDDAARALCESAAAFLPGSPWPSAVARGAAHAAGPSSRPPRRRSDRGRFTRSPSAARGRRRRTRSSSGFLRRSRGAAGRAAAGGAAVRRVTHALAEAGYERAGTVEERGQFSVRGGLPDIFPSTGREPVRAEFFGDSLERLSAFSAFTQRRCADLDHVVVHPAVEAAKAGLRPQGCVGSTRASARVPEGLVSPLPELARSAAIAAWNPEALGAEVDEASPRLPTCCATPPCSRAGVCGRRRRAR
jgi:hypothetical protein